MPGCRIIVLTGLLLASAAADGAQAADEDEKKPVNDTITATKRDLEALKIDRILPADQKLSLPGMEAPSMSMPPVLPAPTSPPDQNPSQNPRQNGTAAGSDKSPTWLIDAMEKDAPHSLDERGRDKTGKSGADFKPEAGRFGDAAETTGPANAPSRADRRETARDEAAELSAVKDAPNPLSGYMAAWMTGRDFNLLLKPEETGAARLPTGSMGAPGQDLPFTGSAGFDAALPGGAVPDPASRSNGPAGAAENPYLEVIALPSPPGLLPAELNAPPPPMSPPRPASASLPPPPAPDQPAPFQSEIRKRDDDAKYFPQLKRF